MHYCTSIYQNMLRNVLNYFTDLPSNVASIDISFIFFQSYHYTHVIIKLLDVSSACLSIDGKRILGSSLHLARTWWQWLPCMIQVITGGKLLHFYVRSFNIRMLLFQ